MKPTARRGTSRDLLLLVLANVLWGSTYVVARGALDTTPPLVLAFVRFSIASLWMLAMGSHRAPKSQNHESDADVGKVAWWLLPLAGIVGFGLAKPLCYVGLAHSTATDAALIINMEAVFTVVLGALLLRQPLRVIQLLGVAVAFAGGVALVWPEGGGGAAGMERAWGNALMVGSVAAEALVSVLGALAVRRYTGMQVTAIATYWGTLTLAPLAVWEWWQAGLSTSWITWPNAAAILYLALAATVLAYALWFYVLGRVDAGRVAVFLYTQPIVGILLGLLIRRELPTRLGVIGGVLVMLGIWVSHLGDDR